MVMAALGFFIFATPTVPYQSLEHSQSWNHPHNAVVGGALPPSQYSGREPDTLSIQAELRPEITGGDLSLKLLRMMAENGQAYPLILGTGRVLGSFAIVAIKESHSQLMHDGKARAIAFTMELKKISDNPIGLKGQALLAAAGVIRSMAGI